MHEIISFYLIFSFTIQNVEKILRSIGFCQLRHYPWKCYKLIYLQILCGSTVEQNVSCSLRYVNVAKGYSFLLLQKMNFYF